jgi:Zn ribbon nucleic-acid-binding protein
MIKFEDCPICDSKESIHNYKIEGVPTRTCQECGYSTNIGMKLGTQSEISVYDSVPTLFKELKLIDLHEYVWYPVSMIEKNKAILFADGKSVDDWGWRVAKYIPAEKDDKFYKENGYKIDMLNSTIFPNTMFPAAIYLYSIMSSQ